MRLDPTEQGEKAEAKAEGRVSTPARKQVYKSYVSGTGYWFLEAPFLIKCTKYTEYTKGAELFGLMNFEWSAREDHGATDGSGVEGLDS